MMSGPTQSKMLVVPPALNLRRASSYNAQDRGPISSTSSRFNFNHLFFSPPASPALPALVPRPPKRTSSQILVARPSRVFRRLSFSVSCSQSHTLWHWLFRIQMPSQRQSGLILDKRSLRWSAKMPFQTSPRPFLSTTTRVARSGPSLYHQTGTSP
ncbi:hypothetical protein QL093DRAFT_1037550 [Fusarium oxysporum]|nr:hypothetical protein QL093DRAFT_1037550 [Fusarium oxysporum]